MLNISAQVTIGSGEEPVRAALLELKDRKPETDNVTSKSGGLVLPRVKLTNRKTLDPFIDSANDPEWKSSDQNIVKKLKDNHAGLIVYNLSVSDPGQANEDLILKQGVYIWDGTEWNISEGGEANGSENFFYMPAFNLPLSRDPDEAMEFDLYGEYERQFTKTAQNTSFISSKAGMTFIPKFGRDKLEYVVTDYDASVLKEISIDASGTTKGTLRYKCESPTAPEGSFINIVFVIVE